MGSSFISVNKLIGNWTYVRDSCCDCRFGKENSSVKAVQM